VNRAHWHVLGAGAMGCLFGCSLQRAGHPVTLILRRAVATPAVPVLLERDNTTDSRQLAASVAADTGHISYLLVTTKAYDVRSAVLSVAHRLDRQSRIVLLANGLGFAEEIRADLPEPDFFCGTTTEGAYRIADRHIRHAGRGLTRIGQTGTERAPSWFSEWARAIRPSLWDPEIDRALWLKLAINCAINPLTALHGCLNGELAQPRLSARVATLCDEIIAISTAAGYAALTADLHRQVARVIADTAANRSSMLQDVQAGRRTEIDYITGYLVRAAHQHGAAAPRNEALLRSVLELDD
jgi:2-dehydropantoate 2-reductase